MQEDIDNQTELDLARYLESEAVRQGFSSTKTGVWVAGMQNLARGEILVRDLLSEFAIEVPSESQALEIGCGFGGVVRALSRQFGHVSAIDVVPERVEWTRRRVPSAEVLQASATRLPWDDARFRLAIANDVFEHIPHAQQHVAAAEIYRVLEPGGGAFIEVPNRFQLIDEHNFVPLGTWLPSDLRRAYVERLSRERSYVECWERSKRGWTRLFASHGFSVKCTGFYIKNFRLFPAHHWKLFLAKP